MPLELLHAHHLHTLLPIANSLSPPYHLSSKLSSALTPVKLKNGSKMSKIELRNQRLRSTAPIISASSGLLDLTEDNIKQALADARTELAQLFDTSVNITGKAELAELDGPYVTIRLSGRFWHKRSTVLARLGNYLKQRIPCVLVHLNPEIGDEITECATSQEILEVDIEDEKQLDDSPENF